MQRQAPFAVERPALHRIGSGPLHRKAGLFGAGQKDIVRAVGDLLNDNSVERRHFDAGRSAGRSTDPRGQQRAAQRCGTLQKTPAI